MSTNGRAQVRMGTILLLMVLFAVASVGAESNPKVVRFIDETSILLTVDSKTATIHVGEQFGNWTLMQILRATAHPPITYAVLEDFVQQNGRLMFVDSGGVKLAFPKSSEATSADPGKLYFGHTFDEVISSPTDSLGQPPWTDFDVKNETITIGPSSGVDLKFRARY